MKITLEMWDEEVGDRMPVELPARYEVCPNCDGHGVKCTLGAMTGSEYAEACHDDEDFADKYRSGFYDGACHECEGNRVIAVVDKDRLDPVMRKRVNDHYEEQANYAAERAAELRYGY